MRPNASALPSTVEEPGVKYYRPRAVRRPPLNPVLRSLVSTSDLYSSLEDPGAEESGLDVGIPTHSDHPHAG